MAARKVSFRGVAVTIACTDLNRSRHFYTAVLGAKPDPRESGLPGQLVLLERGLKVLRVATEVADSLADRLGGSVDEGLADRLLCLTERGYERPCGVIPGETRIPCIRAARWLHGLVQGRLPNRAERSDRRATCAGLMLRLRPAN